MESGSQHTGTHRCKRLIWITIFAVSASCAIALILSAVRVRHVREMELALVQSLSDRTGAGFDLIRIAGVTGLWQINIIRLRHEFEDEDTDALAETVELLPDVHTIEAGGTTLNPESVRRLKAAMPPDVFVGSKTVFPNSQPYVTRIRPQMGQK